MFRIRELLNPKHTALSVAQRLVQGLEDGSIVLGDEIEAEAIESGEQAVTSEDEPEIGAVESTIDRLALLRQGIEQWNQWRLDNPDVKPDLSGANLSNADLSFARLSSANLFHTDLSGANLSLANLRGAILTFANLNGANLNGANLINADLRGAVLSNADLRYANLIGANLSGVNLNGANLINADLSPANLNGANLSGANLINADLRGANLNGANVTNALLGNGLGLSDTEKQDLTQRGAIFDDAPGDRSSTPSSPVRR